MTTNPKQYTSGWLLFFYTLPSKPVRNRMTIWRKLIKAGALPFRGSLYILPNTEEHYELFTCLVSEVIALKGKASFVRVEKIETDNNQQLVALFNNQRESAYQPILNDIDEIERRLSSIRIGSNSDDKKRLTNQIIKAQRDFEEMKKIDFFFSERGRTAEKKLESLHATLNGLSGSETTKPDVNILPTCIEDYQKRRWATRKKPFVDRFASSWLIKKFIDKDASFIFIDEKEMDTLAKDVIPFDIRGGRFTHTGNLCTFEVLLKSFALKGSALKKMAAIVHELDLKDDKYRNPESKGIEDILFGIRKTSKDDYECLEKGIALFEMFYASKA